MTTIKKIIFKKPTTPFLLTMFGMVPFFFSPVVQAQVTDASGLQVAQKSDEADKEVKDVSQNILPGKPTSDSKNDLVEDEAEGKKDIYLNFENTELSNFINYMAELKKINLIPDKTMAGNKVSLIIRNPLSKDEAWNIFLTVLEMAGFSIIETDNVYKIVPKDKKLQQPLPAYINVPYKTLPDSDLVIRYVYFLQNLQAESLQDLIGSMLSDKHSVVPQGDVNALIITDKSYNIKSAIKVIEELEQAGDPETVVVIRLQRANAVDVKNLLTTLTQDPEGGALARLLGKRTEGTTKYFPPGTKIIAEERTNSLFLIGARSPIEKIEKFITEHVDTELKASQSPLHIYELQYADARQIADILKNVTEVPEGGPGQQAAKYGAIRGGVKYFKTMNFQVDKEGNRLIASSTDKEDWKMLKKTIQDLDKPQPLVAIETLFVSVDATNIKALGGVTRNKKEGQLGNHIDFQSPGPAGPTLGPPDPVTCETPSNPLSLLGNLFQQFGAVADNGTTFVSIGKACNIWSIFYAVQQQTNAAVLAQPFITVANKRKATIEVTTQQRLLQEDGGSSNVKGFEQVEAAKKLTITPQINLDGIIRLDIEVNFAEFLPDGSGTKTERVLNTGITVADGQVLVLGGFVQTLAEDAISKTPILGDIPLIGWLFKNHKRTITRQYIFIFMSPTVIKPRQTPGMQLYTKMKLHQVTDEIEEAIVTKKTPDPIFNWYFNAAKEQYSHKVVDFANARYQPTTVDIRNDPYYRSQVPKEEALESSDQEMKPVLAVESSLERPVQAGGHMLAEKPAIKTEVIDVTNTGKDHVLAQIVPTEPLQVIQSSPVIKEGLEQKRNKLKDLLAERQESSPVKDDSLPERKRDNLKNFFSESTAAENEKTLSIDVKKRKSLKNFFSMKSAITNDVTAHRPLAANEESA